MRVNPDIVFRPLLGPLLVGLCWTAHAADEAPNGVPPNVDVTPYRQNITAIESEHGALDYRLAEHFLSLGLAYRANDEPEQAVAALRQALHVNRINKGLHHLMHVPIVDLLIETNAGLSDWPAVEQQHRYRYWIHRREVDANSDDFVDAAIVFSAWETYAYDLDTGVPAFQQLRDAQDALKAAANTVVAKNGDADPRMVRILNLQAMANLNLAIHVTNTEVDPVTGGPVSGETVTDVIARRNLILECFVNGKQALEQVVNLSEGEDTPIQHGLALANLADWELIFDRPQSSTRNYRRAYSLLKSAGLSEQELALEFAEPRKMSQFTVKRRQADADTEAVPDPKVAYVKATFKVTSTGHARNVKVVEAKPAGNSRIIRRARAALRDARFRPRINDQGPVEAASTIRYIFPDEAI